MRGLAMNKPDCVGDEHFTDGSRRAQPGFADARRAQGVGEGP